MSEWIVAHCHANAETRAEAHLKRQGFDVYLPKYKKTRRHARRVDTVIRPLFPRYLFIGFDEQLTPWRPIRSTVGVNHLITAGERPLAVPLWVIDQLRQREDDSGFVTGADENDFTKGDRVDIISGPFFEHQGVFDSRSDQQRVTVLLDIMGRQVKARIPREVIRAAS